MLRWLFTLLHARFIRHNRELFYPDIRFKIIQVPEEKMLLGYCILATANSPMSNCSLVKRNNIPVEYLRPFIFPFAAVKQQVQRKRSRWRCVEDGAIKATALPAASLRFRSYACRSIIVSLASTVQVHVQHGEKNAPGT